MKKRISVFSLLLMIMLLTVMPGAALAGNHAGTGNFYASGVITGIEDTNIGENAFPIGDTGDWQIEDRDIYGELTGDVNSDFTLTYDGVFSIATQEGELTGTMAAGDFSCTVEGYVQPLEMVMTELGIELPLLTITGTWEQENSHSNCSGQQPDSVKPGKNRNNWFENWWKNGRNQYGTPCQKGSFTAWVVFVPDGAGHVTQIIDSSFEMTGIANQSRSCPQWYR